jgi:hypothetical protein
LSSGWSASPNSGTSYGGRRRTRSATACTSSARLRYVNYRVLYSFHGRVVAVLLHALTKEEAVPDGDIDLAVARKRAFDADPEAHTFVPTQL